MATQDGKARGDIRACWVEIAVALMFVVAAAVVITDSIRVGATWGPDGPRAGYFPFYIGCILGIAGAGIVVQALRRWKSLAAETFVTRDELKPVLTMLWPTLVYVALIVVLGIYVASAIYIGTFMFFQGKYKWPSALAVSLGVPIAMFLMFEMWFLVPLPKGPLEHVLGY
ncbi:MAG: tripartite tricarboxylate transporter TctB family protein [Pseudomonadota bacterium]|nr:tripartite tricarboxylate transporter TctB family protein [Pseudomonadota bacterium]